MSSFPDLMVFRSRQRRMTRQREGMRVTPMLQDYCEQKHQNLKRQHLVFYLYCYQSMPVIRNTTTINNIFGQYNTSVHLVLFLR